MTLNKVGRFISEQQLQGELNLALAVRRFGDHSGRGAGDSAVEKDRVRSIKVPGSRC